MEMTLLTLHREQFFKWSIPYWVFFTPCSPDSGIQAGKALGINERPVVIMQSKEVNIQVPPGLYDLSIGIVLVMWKWRFQIRGGKRVLFKEGQHLDLTITDRERWWNILFNIDLVFWLAKLFFELPYPWNVVYEIVSNGFFILWAIRIWHIRNSYFKIIEQ